jgi:serine protease Do
MGKFKYIWIVVLSLVIGSFCYAQPNDDDEKEPGFLGVQHRELTDDDRENLEYEGDGVVIVSVLPETPAEKAELEPDDIIMAVDKEEVTSCDELHSIIMDKGEGTEVELKIWREGKEIKVKAKLMARSPEGQPFPPPEEDDDEEEE